MCIITPNKKNCFRETELDKLNSGFVVKDKFNIDNCTDLTVALQLLL